MNKLILTLCLASFLVSFTSCTSDETEDSEVSAILGVWKLTAWNINGAFDMNNDGSANSNLLNEIDCPSNETLVFNNNGVVSLNTTFNPEIEIALLDATSDLYQFDITCDTEGVVSLATEYSINDTLLMIGGNEARIENDQIFIVFEERLKIYNQERTEIIETKDLTLVYSKQQ